MAEREPLTYTFEEAARYLENARGQLRRCPLEDGFYKDTKPVREAFGAAWLAIDTALKAALLNRGVPRQKIPRSWDALLAASKQHLGVRNGKLTRMLVQVHHLIHLGGYYYGDLNSKSVAESALADARRVIETLSGWKIG